MASYAIASRTGVTQVSPHELIFWQIGFTLASDDTGMPETQKKTDGNAPTDAIADYICEDYTRDPTTYAGRVMYRHRFRKFVAA
jgi:hypothetical protein